MIQFQVVSSNDRSSKINLFQSVEAAREFAQQQAKDKSNKTVSVTVVVDHWQNGKKVHPSE